MAPPSLVIVGHVTKDLAEGGAYALGGGATYAALTARALGYDTAVLTRAAPDVAAALPAALPGVSVRCLPSPVTTTFRNLYTRAGRRQQLLAVAPPLRRADVPMAWREAPLALLAPVAGETDAEVGEVFTQARLAVAAQGLLREWDDSGWVRPAPWQGDLRLLERADAVIFSEEDVQGDEALVAAYAGRARLLVLTRGARGATVFVAGKATDVPAFPAREIEPTGAGDVFATAYLIVYNETRDPLVAARFACCAAAFVVEQPGAAGVPTRAQVLARLSATASR